MKQKPFIIAISAVSGGGKTTTVNELFKLLPNTKVISFDNYEGDLLQQDYCQWSEMGTDYNEWHLEPLINDIMQLIYEKPEFILLDYPFGYGNKAVGKFIDFAVFIDTPLDITLARRLLRDYVGRDKSRHIIENPMDHMKNTLSFYLERHRETYLQHIKTVMPFVDLVVDGKLPVGEIAEQIFNHISNISK